jgi:hypothetical protein
MHEQQTDEVKGGRSENKLVFVSYASADQTMATALVEEVERRGIPCWMAPRDVPFGSNYGAAIVEAIECAEVMLALLSANANNSIHVANEIERAVSYRKPVIPVRPDLPPLRARNEIEADSRPVPPPAAPRVSEPAQRVVEQPEPAVDAVGHAVVTGLWSLPFHPEPLVS